MDFILLVNGQLLLPSNEKNHIFYSLEQGKYIKEYKKVIDRKYSVGEINYSETMKKERKCKQIVSIKYKKQFAIAYLDKYNILCFLDTVL